MSARDETPIVAPGRPPMGQDTLRGAAWLVTGAFVGIATWSQVKVLGQSLPSIQISFFRGLAGLIVITPFMLRVGRKGFRTKHPWLQLLRGVNASIILTLGFYAITHLPIAQITSISFSRPLFLLVLAALILHEVVHRHRIAATVIGFIGVLIIVRPTADMEPAMFAALGNALFMAFGVILIKLIAKDDRTETLVFYVTLLQATFLFIPAMIFWQTPSLDQLAMLFGIGVTGTLMQTCLVRAYRYAEASALAPFDYTRLIFASVVGYFVFGEVVDIYTWLGAAILIGATFYIARREAVLQKA